jgi:hypothetical protein
MKICPICGSGEFKLNQGLDKLIWYQCCICNYAEVKPKGIWKEAFIFLGLMFAIAIFWLYMVGL